MREHSDHPLALLLVVSTILLLTASLFADMTKAEANAELSEALYATFSTIAGTLGTIFGFMLVFVMFKLDSLHRHLSDAGRFIDEESERPSPVVNMGTLFSTDDRDVREHTSQKRRADDAFRIGSHCSLKRQQIAEIVLLEPTPVFRTIPPTNPPTNARSRSIS
ncbi:MAG: hypothetical protein O3A29_22935 [Planctomycetota bacterium]|nr:hypothetical protein [Planctomycetota bacterium]